MGYIRTEQATGDRQYLHCSGGYTGGNDQWQINMRENCLEIGVSDSFGPFVAVDDEDGEEAVEDVHTEEGQGVDGQQFG